MSARLTQAALVVVVIIAAAQFIRPERANPPTDAARTIHAHAPVDGLGPVLERACRDCHSNATVWPWYSKVAPLSWAMAYGVNKGREAVNFSDWASYSPAQQRDLLAESCEDASAGKMPDRLWTLLHPEARLSEQDIDTICAAVGGRP